MALSRFVEAGESRCTNLANLRRRGGTKRVKADSELHGGGKVVKDDAKLMAKLKKRGAVPTIPH